MINLWEQIVTIYNDVPATTLTPRTFYKSKIYRCQIQGSFVSKMNNTIQNIVNAKTVITKDIERYKTPVEYDKLPVDQKSHYYTARVGDFVIFGEVDDIVTTSQEFAQLQNKYKDNGIKVNTVNVNINNMNVDNIMLTNA